MLSWQDGANFAKQLPVWMLRAANVALIDKCSKFGCCLFFMGEKNEKKVLNYIIV